ncbi:hypothetical protein GCK72_018091 [Caenorhabditis remanei]|uniref:Trehalase n=1 Tax=Caenorhabditis remanei TaxID=31234 RepID=A0A6A5G8Z6_CAERE|nr:hypothetical protein GCK72_018091 [Caenorhabditis remanei]KAF1751537.1 hypothetical protein GCK72_018091 [Caenorhabditis remanei]
MNIKERVDTIKKTLSLIPSLPFSSTFTSFVLACSFVSSIIEALIYNVIGSYPQPGSGGEYDVQDGFGWTNGAILDLLLTYNDRLFVPDNFINATTASPVQTTTKVALTQLQNSWVIFFAILIYQLF